MNIETMVHIINLILSPVVMVSGCALILSAFLHRYESIGGRLREMHKELLDLLRMLEQHQANRAVQDLEIGRLRQAEIEEQIPRLMHRYVLARNALLLVEVAVIMFVVDMFTIALAELIPSLPLLAIMPLVGFLLGVTLLFISLACSIIEVFASHREVTYEATHRLSLSRSQPH